MTGKMLTTRAVKDARRFVAIRSDLKAKRRQFLRRERRYAQQVLCDPDAWESETLALPRVDFRDVA